MIKKTLIAASLLLIASSAIADNVNDSMTDIEEVESTLQKSANEIVEDSYGEWLRELSLKREQYCEAHDLSEYDSHCNVNDSIVFGDASVKLKPSSPKWVDARAMAYNEALLDAYKKVAIQLSLSNQVETLKTLNNDPTPPELNPKKIQSTLDSLMEKTLALSGGKLDAKLKEMGIDPAKYNSEPPSAKKMMLQNTISQTSITRAIADTSGMIPLQTFEGNDNEGNYVIRVVISTQPDRIALAKDILKNGAQVMADSAKKSKKSINSQIILSSDVMFNQFGTRILRDKQGYPVLIAFGQAGVQQGSSNSSKLDIARSIASTNARNALTNLLNSSTQFKETAKTLVIEFTEMKRTANTDGGYDDSEHTEADLMHWLNSTTKNTSQVTNFAGAKEIHSWTYTHPIYNHKVVGVVMMWSPKTAKQAKEISTGSTSKPVSNTYQSDKKIKIQSNVTRGIETDDYDF